MFCAGYGSLPNSAAIFFDFLLRALRLAYENQLRKLMYLPECLFCTASKSASRKAENKENRARGMGRRLHPAPLCCHKSASKSPSMRCCVLFAVCHVSLRHVFFVILRPLCFFADFLSAVAILLALWESVCCRTAPCAAIADDLLHPGCVVYLTVRIALRDRSV